jgi:cyclophilin family peptidyl-prolyl cis-trans isomerase
MKKAMLVSSVLFLTSLGLLACSSSQPATQKSATATPEVLQFNTASPSPKLSTLTEMNGNSTQTTQPNQKGPTMKTLKDFEDIKAKEATITTSKGDITFTLYQDKVPTTVANFLNLAKSGYYNGIKFHRIIPDFMAQVGDPLTKDDSKKALWGTGGPGYTIADEFDPSLKHDAEGTVSMANAGPNTGGSQIFITYEATPWLDGHHAVFGRVTKGMDVLRKLEIGDEILKVSYK